MADCTDNGFNALDEACYLDGYSFNAQTAKWIRSNANSLACNLSARPFASQSWPIHQIATTDAVGVGYRLSALRWKPIAPAYVGMVGPHTRELRLRLFAQIEAGYTVYMYVGNGWNDKPPADPVAAVADANPQCKALVGDGTLKRYPETGTWRVPVQENRQAQIVVWLTGVDRIAATMSKGLGGTFFDLTTAAVASVAGAANPAGGGAGYQVDQLDGVSVNAAGEFTTADFYAYIGGAGGGGEPILGGGPRRIRAATTGADGWFALDGKWSASPIGRCINFCRGPWVQIADLSLTGYPITDDDLSRGNGGVSDWLGYARQKLLSALPAAVLSECHGQYLTMRNLVCDNWIEPRRVDVTSESYPAGAHARYPVELSRTHGAVKLHVEVMGEGIGSGSLGFFQVQTVDLAGGGVETSGDNMIVCGEFVNDEASDEARGYQIESRFASPAAGVGACDHAPTVDTADETTYRQEVIIRVRCNATSPLATRIGSLRIRGVRIWEVYDP